MYLSFDFFFVL